ncbi:glycoside hydrolase family 97 catalytic domain-containing protein [Pseudoduganella sp. SL102]|uniref:glycoside hydrolase family 97 protein n=1 Tax=Pseudoduganella sp. SL102 TaxID=2995154 RepID=UPI00248C034D|nr:glycoside hydrolase family 97 protein [Pseudoduganella sp. SL102]WBS00958.1 glycoside hydrolase family 97 catalytic domain-containing protein [Pseudoduganella sp. SL102]
MTMKPALYRILAASAFVAAPSFALAFAQPSQQTVTSPDGKLAVTVAQAKDGGVTYRIARAGKPVLRHSALGLSFDGADFTKRLSAQEVSAERPISEQYELVSGKRRHVTYAANERTWRYLNNEKQPLEITFRVSNDGVAFRYTARAPELKFAGEATTFAFPAGARAWLQPMSGAKTGFARTNPSYEEHCRVDIPVGTAAPMGAGWVFPALFRTGDTYVALTEANLDGTFHASRLAAQSPGGVYRIAGPAAQETFTDGALLPTAQGQLTTPWRVLAIGSLATVVDSTLGTDLAMPSREGIPDWVKPGQSSWSWAILKDDFTTFGTQKQFIDYAADMGWEYTLIDAYWDQKIGYDKVKELVEYARPKNVGILVWYNSAGAWNDTDMTPRGKLLTSADRRAEFAKLRTMGVKGIKVDFFGGDGQSMIDYYVGILRDAYDAQLLVNFHGATLPRGWSRTWPNLVTAEAVRGFEFGTFDQKDQDPVAGHAAMLPFTRNLFDPMDFTPMVFGDIPKIRRATRNGFELAESVLFVSGIQHFAEVPQGMASVPDYVKDFLRALPDRWDDSRFIAGEPGKFAVIARQAGGKWYVAGFNGAAQERTVTLDLSFIGNAGKPTMAKPDAGKPVISKSILGKLITDGATERAFAQSDLKASRKTSIRLKARGGFVAVFE